MDINIKQNNDYLIIYKLYPIRGIMHNNKLIIYNSNLYFWGIKL